VVTVYFLGILRVLIVTRLKSDGDLRFYRVTRNRTAEVFLPCVAAGAPELRRPRFSFLYVQLVKEPATGEHSGDGGERAPLLSQNLRTTDPIDQLANLNFGDHLTGSSTKLQNREPPYLNYPTASVKAFFLDFLGGEAKRATSAASRWPYITPLSVNARLKKTRKPKIFQSWGKNLDN